MTTPPRSNAATKLARHLARVPQSRVGSLIIAVCVVVVAAVVTAGVVKDSPTVHHPRSPVPTGSPGIGTFSQHPVVINLPSRAASYLGIFARGVPASYAPVEAVAHAVGVQPNVALYYSGWDEVFRSAFAIEAARNGTIPFVQVEPSGVNLKAIVAGVYDTELETFATDVASYGAKTGKGIIIGFGHEMNGTWYSWGYRHTSPAVFVAAWRHIVTVFRQQGADDVTWLWTVNIIGQRAGIPSPAPWWPGSSYVTWVGIDGYYFKPSWTFASLFGPTIKAVRALTLDPILISETGAAPLAGKPVKIADLFAGVRSYGLLGFVWFDADGVRDWRLSTPAALAAFRQGAEAYKRPGP